MPTPGLLGACSRARRESTPIDEPSLFSGSRLRALRALPARALPLPYPCSPSAARGWEGLRLPRQSRVLRRFSPIAQRSSLNPRHRLPSEHERQSITLGAVDARRRATACAFTPSRPAWERAPREGATSAPGALIYASYGGRLARSSRQGGLRPLPRRARGDSSCANLRKLPLVATYSKRVLLSTGTLHRNRSACFGVNSRVVSSGSASGARSCSETHWLTSSLPPFGSSSKWMAHSTLAGVWPMLAGTGISQGSGVVCSAFRRSSYSGSCRERCSWCATRWYSCATEAPATFADNHRHTCDARRRYPARCEALAPRCAALLGRAAGAVGAPRRTFRPRPTTASFHIDLGLKLAPNDYLRGAAARAAAISAPKRDRGGY
jgi:hypothetical protein